MTGPPRPPPRPPPLPRGPDAGEPPPEATTTEYRVPPPPPTERDTAPPAAIAYPTRAAELSRPSLDPAPGASDPRREPESSRGTMALGLVSLREPEIAARAIAELYRAREVDAKRIDRLRDDGAATRTVANEALGAAKRNAAGLADVALRVERVEHKVRALEDADADGGAATMVDMANMLIRQESIARDLARTAEAQARTAETQAEQRLTLVGHETKVAAVERRAALMGVLSKTVGAALCVVGGFLGQLFLHYLARR